MSGENESEPGDAQDKELAGKVEEVGLDAKFWLPVLQKKIGIRNVQSLQHVGREEYAVLEIDIQNDWERKALRRLFNIQDRSEQITEELKERYEQASVILKQMEELSSQRKTHQSESVKQKVEEMQKVLEIPSECSAPSDKTLEDLIDHFQKHLNLIGDSCLDKKPVTDMEILRSASGGLALEGIYKIKHADDACLTHQPLLEVPSRLRLVDPEQGLIFEQKEFTSSLQEKHFEESVEKLGFVFSSSIDFSHNSFDVEATSDHGVTSDSEGAAKSSGEETYICTRYNYIPLASYSFTKDQLNLSREAINELKDIEDSIDSTDEQSLKPKCEQFFKRFGSHANMGPIHFGGVFRWKASMDGIQEDQLQEVKKVTSEALRSYVCATYYGTGGTSDVSRASSQRSVESDTDRTYRGDIQFSITQIGGPPEAGSPLQWEAGLKANNKTWSVIGRGLELVPVWEIILTNHKKDFTDVVKLCGRLVNSYELLTNLTVNPGLGEPADVALEEAECFLQEIKSWEIDDVEANLERLCDHKQNISEKTKSDSAWVEECLSDKGLQDFLFQTIEKYIDTAVPEKVKLLTRQLLEPRVYSGDKFPKASFIMERISDNKSDKSVCEDEFTEFSEMLQRIKEELKQVTFNEPSSEKEIQQAKQRITSDITRALCSLIKSRQSEERADRDLLLLCIANGYGFCVHSYVCQRLLGWEDIELMKDEMIKAHTDYRNVRERGLPQAQAFVLLTGLRTRSEVTSEFKQERLNYMKQFLAGSLSSEVNDILDKHTEDVNWNILEESLKSFINNSAKRKLGEITAQVVQDLENVHQKMEKPTETNSETKETEFNTDFITLLNRLGLETYYPQKMTKKDFHVIGKCAEGKNEVVENQIPFLFLEKLLTLDYRARYLQGEQNSKSNSELHINVNKIDKLNNSVNLESLLDDSEEESEDSPSSPVSPVHPMDIQMAIFHCADDIARQYIYTKLSFCQFAVPLLVPNINTKCIEFPLWSFQEIKKKWKSKTKESNKTIEKQITEAETPFVTFIRFGSSSSSKSKILNSLMGNPKHHIFFHRDCEGSTRHCLLMNGVVEIAWYCPGGKDSDLFDDCIAFTNLRGDAREHERQVKFLLEVSSVFVILLTDADTKDTRCKKVLDEIVTSSKSFILLFSNKERTQRKSGIVKIGLKNRNKAELIQEIRMEIKSILANSTPTCSLYKCAINARTSGFLVDEDNQLCKNNKEKTQVLMALLEEKQLMRIKKDLLPLQGNLWHEWCQKDKELTRLTGKSPLSIEQQLSDIKTRKHRIRQDQLNRAFPLNDFMRSFKDILHSGSQISNMYFLQWLKIHLDKISSENLSVLHQKYHDLWTQIQEEKQPGGTIQTLENDLESLSNEINDSSFGLEHILREVGQIYEATETLHIEEDRVSMLPEIAAKLMVSGYPVELMDGDAAHVPLTWITAVLDKVIGTIGDKRIFVLSVLGIQSTGKSTLLNAMFGLQFAVSAGRCTRGAFMQLIEVDETLRGQMRFDFVLVIDTEGLRAIELSHKTTRNHDNELATFVIGLGNITLINIFGENPSEMQDILQIAVQAFLRMKQVRIKPSCLFVHQNVGEITARERNMEGRRKLQENLNKMTLIAAEQEHCEVISFSEVISFDVNTHIHYFTQLWEGDPPMAPPNPGYSQNVQDLKQIILDIGRKETLSNNLTISQFKARVMDLWNALLNENFVFSFRNSLEISVYKKLETAYGQWTWELRKRMLDVENELCNLIQNDKIQSVDRSDLNKQLQETYDAVMKKLGEFFSNEKDQDILIQWEENTKKRVTSVKHELVEETKKKTDELITSRKNSKKINEMKGKCEDELFRRSRELAVSLKGRELNEEILEENFNKMWNSWIEQVKREMPPTETPPIKKDLENILLERFNKHPDLQNLIAKSYKWKDVNEEFSEYISTKTKWHGWKNEKLSKKEKQSVEETTRALEVSVNTFLQQKEGRKMDYQSNYFHEILHQIEMGVETKIKTFRFQTDYLLFVTLYLFQKAGHGFIEMSDAFRKANDPLRRLESKRNQFFQSFRISCDEKQKITSLSDFLSNRLQETLQKAVSKKAAIDVADEMKCNVTAFNGNRSKLEFHLLKSLAEKEDFQSFMTYINEPKTAFETFIKECVDQYYRDNSPGISVTLQNNLDRFRKLIQSAIENSSRITKACHGGVSFWLDTFRSELSAHLTLSDSDLKGVKYQDIKDIDFLEEAMTKALETVAENLKCYFSRHIISNIAAKPYVILYAQLAGCWETCPFCRAVCTNTVPGHKEDHSVQFHRPQGLSGWFFHTTDHLVTGICSTYVASDTYFMLHDDSRYPHKEYRKAGPPFSEWSITPDLSSLNYWKWVVCRFQSDIEKHYNNKFKGYGEIPAQWREITKEDAISEINGYI